MTDSLSMLEHIIPQFQHPTELALEHFKVINELKKSCQNSRLPNVRFLRIGYLFEANRVALNILNLGLHKLESLYFNDCPKGPMETIISRVGHQLTRLSIYYPSGAVDFLEMIDWCPNLKDLDISEGFYQFESSNYVQTAPQHLETLYITLSNKFNVQLPAGEIARLVF